MDQIAAHVLRDGETEVTVLSIGCAVMDWRIRGRPVVLGYASPEHYRQNPASMGVICGRVANRISGARFTLDGEIHELPSLDLLVVHAPQPGCRLAVAMASSRGKKGQDTQQAALNVEPGA